MEALARFVEYYNHERLHEAIPQMGARTLSKKIGPTVPEDLTTYTRQKSLFDEEEPEPSSGGGTVQEIISSILSEVLEFPGYESSSR